MMTVPPQISETVVLVITVDLSGFQRCFSSHGQPLKFWPYNWHANKNFLFGLPARLRFCWFGQPARSPKGSHSCEAIWRDWNGMRKQFIQTKWALRVLTPDALYQPNKSDWLVSSYKYYTGKCLDVIIAPLPGMEDLLERECEDKKAFSQW